MCLKGCELLPSDENPTVRHANIWMEWKIPLYFLGNFLSLNTSATVSQDPACIGIFINSVSQEIQHILCHYLARTQNETNPLVFFTLPDLSFGW